MPAISFEVTDRTAQFLTNTCEKRPNMSVNSHLVNRLSPGGHGWHLLFLVQ
jgi:hypothetical protein